MQRVTCGRQMWHWRTSKALAQDESVKGLTTGRTPPPLLNSTGTSPSARMSLALERPRQKLWRSSSASWRLRGLGRFGLDLGSCKFEASGLTLIRGCRLMTMAYGAGAQCL